MADQCQHQPPKHPQPAAPAPSAGEADDASPFVHRFRTARNFYAYDVSTRRIAQVSPAVWAILDDAGRLPRDAVIARHGSAHGVRQVEAALDQIAQARQDGLFLAVRPSSVVGPKPERVLKELENGRQQLILNVTNECNFRCSYCIFGGQYVDRRTHSRSAMTWPVARAAIDEFLQHSSQSGSRVISLYGGEPLLNFPLVRECVRHVRSRRGGSAVQFSITTNGSLLAGRRAEFLAREGFLIAVSLDGPAELHDRHRRTRRGRPTWEKIAGNLRSFLAGFPEYARNGKLRFNAVAAATTDLRRVQAFFDSCDFIHESMGLEINEQKEAAALAPAVPGDPLFDSRLAMYRDFVQCLKSGAYAAERNSRSRRVQTSAFQKPFVTFHRRGYRQGRLPAKVELRNTCTPGARRTFVTAAGDYYACERVADSPHGILGNVREGVVPEKVLALLAKWASAGGDECRRCWCMPTCMAGCFATVEEAGEVTPAAKGQACALHLRNMHALLADYCTILEDNPRAFDFVKDMTFS